MKKALLSLAALTSIAFLSAAQANAYPSILKLGVINSNKLIEEVKPNIKKANAFLSEVANQNAIDVIYEEAAYVASDGDITEPIIAGLKTNAPSSSIKLNYLKIGPTIAVVNAEKIFTESKQARLMLQVLNDEFKPGSNFAKSDYEKRKLALRTVIAGNVNTIIKEYAEKQGITLLLQEAAFVSESHEITGDLIALLNEEKNLNQVAVRQAFSKPTRLIYVNADRIYFNFEKNKGGSQSERIKDRTEIAKRADALIKVIVAKNDINIVSQKAAFLNPAIDATPELISEMTKDALAIQPLK